MQDKLFDVRRSGERGGADPYKNPCLKPMVGLFVTASSPEAQVSFIRMLDASLSFTCAKRALDASEQCLLVAEPSSPIVPLK